MLDLLADLGRISLTNARQQVNGIPAESFARLPEVDGKRVVTNHPAFIIGHLSLYPGRIAGLLELSVAGAEVPESWKDRFAPGKPCEDDPDATVYPARDELVATFEHGMEGVIAGLSKADPDRLRAEFPKPKLRDRFPTVGAAVSHMIAGHAQFHLGQLSAWRRVMGLPPAG